MISAIKIFGCAIGDARACAAIGVVDQNIDFAQLPNHLIDQAWDRIGITLSEGQADMAGAG